ncbi:hypothetical protein [Mucispirillum schaedleri]|uniref:hypothetical protein n=1 Tax=Mucispirillum schaedleri TaxID=248039 RepID=UPI001F596D01|nr:hypothetical protein [Mucispirillum schaedleri]
MIYRYETENNILKQGSLFQIPFKSANGYSVRMDNEALAEKLDYIIDGSKLWIERNIAGKVFSISDNVEDETETLLARIGQLETNLNALKSSVEDNKKQLASLLEALDILNNLQSEKDNTYEEMFRVLTTNIDSSSQALETLRDSVDEDISALMDMAADVEHNLNSRIEQVLNTATDNYSALQKEIAGVYDKLISNDVISALNSKYERLESVTAELKRQADNIPVSADKEEFVSLSEKLSSLKQSLAMETAQRRRADMEIKLLLERTITDMDRLEDIIIGNLGDQDIVIGILDKIKEEFNLSLDRLARITTANMTRAFKLKQELKNIKGGAA